MSICIASKTERQGAPSAIVLVTWRHVMYVRMGELMISLSIRGNFGTHSDQAVIICRATSHTSRGRSTSMSGRLPICTLISRRLRLRQ